MDYAEFKQRGYQVIPNVIDREMLSSLSKEARRVMNDAQQLVHDSKDQQDGSYPYLHNILSAHQNDDAIDGHLSLHIEHVFRYSPIFKSFISDQSVVQHARAVCSSELQLLDDQLFWKPPCVGGATYVHRDSDFFGPLEVITTWIPFVDVDEGNGCICFVPGSHKQDAQLSGIHKRSSPPPGVEEHKRPIDYFYEVDWSTAKFESVAMSAGDVLLINSNVLHCSHEVVGERERLSYIIEYVSNRDVELYRTDPNLAGLFGYHDRLKYMHPVQ